MIKKTMKLPFRKELNLVGFEILSLEELYSKKNALFLTNTKILQFYEIIFIEKGEGEHFIDFNSYAFNTGSIIFVGKHQAHSWQKYRTFKGYVILFTENFLYKNQIQFSDLSYDYPFNPVLYNPVSKIPDQTHFEAFRTLVQCISHEHTLPSYAAQQEVLQTLLRTLILKVKSILPTTESRTEKQSKELFVQLQKALDQNVQHTKTANDYINLLGASYHQVNSAVKKYTNMSLKMFIDNMLILNAKRLLSGEENSVYQTAYTLGFDEATNFTKFFKKHTGQTPKEFREFVSK